ncbi:hypothetical protein Pint_17976 [Pistacia integerrima]|uniref:Uncharacterized protein n=1 Tax=Pistacia integerrima TaxID=434235 RepID=A0ACC0YVW3_9ROSI|nr:hypothetical protein Pint_17976 [Pistacia integerrima]
MEDTCNENLGIIGFARVLIQGDAARKLPDMVRVRVPTEENIELKAMSVRVDFQWKPSQCGECKVFGHFDENCLIQVKKGARSNEKGSRKGLEGEIDGFKVLTRKDKG